jgi:pSer/pThr/pTyr-binding forkhead associated (FHA) protein/ribosomal protein L40E
MAISCPSCGLANSDGATECRRCRAPFTDSGSEDISAGLGTLCQRCEAYNEPGVERCTTCGYKLSPQPAAKAAGNLDKEAPAQHDGSADSNGPRTTPDTEPVWPEEATPAASLGAEQQAARTGPLPRGWAAAEAAMADATQRRRAAASIAVPTPPPQPPLALKACPSCLAQNPPAAKFCSECGTSFPRSAPASSDTPFAREPARPAEEPAAEPEPSDDWAANTDPTGRPAYAADDDGSQQAEPPDSTPESLGWDAAIGEAAATEENAFATALQEAVDAGVTPGSEPEPEAAIELPSEPEPDLGSQPGSEIAFDAPPEPEVALEAPPEPELPYQASLVVERGNAAGTSFFLGQIENVLGGAGAPIELPDDPHLAARHAAVLFEEQRLMLRDEGSANGVYVKLRDASPIEPGDYFVAGERMLRFDGPCELPVGDAGETPYLGAPRPEGAAVRVTEILRGGKTGRVCFRSGPTIAIGRTGCDLNFGTDALLAPRHAELRIAPDGTATLVDLNAAPSGVFLRLRPQQTIELQPGDVIQLGDQQLRLDVA